jgi:putative FmdB family regulatory protein
MPIYEFICRKCEHAFEALVPRPGAKSPCPECGSKRVAQQISAPAGFSVKGSEGSCPVSGREMSDQCSTSG